MSSTAAELVQFKGHSLPGHSKFPLSDLCGLRTAKHPAMHFTGRSDRSSIKWELQSTDVPVCDPGSSQDRTCWLKTANNHTTSLKVKCSRAVILRAETASSASQSYSWTGCWRLYPNQIFHKYEKAFLLTTLMTADTGIKKDFKYPFML